MYINCEASTPYITISDTVREAYIPSTLYMCSEIVPPDFVILPVNVVLTQDSNTQTFDILLGTLNFKIITKFINESIIIIKEPETYEGTISSFTSPGSTLSVQFVNSPIYPTRNEESYEINLFFGVQTSAGPSLNNVGVDFSKPKVRRFRTGF